MSAPRIPPLLEPYLAPLPRGALVLLTSVLGARANWLVVRFIYALLRRHVDDEGQRQGDHDETPGVVLLSFMRDEAFWHDAASKMSLDLNLLARRGAFVFVPGLTGLFAPTAPSGSDALSSLVAAVDAALAQLGASRPILILPRAPLASPSAHLSQQQLPASGRSREYKSAEDAQQELSGGRPELLPKLVHYGGHQPPTPPSPALGNRHNDGSRSASKRRTRAEYEDGGSPPLGHGPAPTRRGPFGEGRDSPETQRQKKDEFLRLCSRAWDLFHS